MTFLKAQERTKFQAESVAKAQKAVEIALAQYKGGIIDLTRVIQLETTLVQLQDTLALAQGEIGLGLIQVYRALGGGWQIRLTGCEPTILTSQADQKTEDGAEPKQKSGIRSGYGDAQRHGEQEQETTKETEKKTE